MEVGRGLAIIEDSVDAWKQWLEDNLEKRWKATKNNTDNTRINRTKRTRKQKWEEIQLYGRFKRLTSDISLEKT